MTRLNHFSRFERAARKVIEGSFGRVLGKGPMPSDIAQHLVQAVETGQRDGLAPDEYFVLLSPDDKLALEKKYPELEQRLTDFVLQVARDSDIGIGAGLKVKIAADPRIDDQQVVVNTNHSYEDDELTQANRDYKRNALSSLRALDAFLIVDGKRHVSLDRPIIRLGRHVDNDVVIAAPTVSRQHAQIRWRYGKFVIFDLGSRSGTGVNGRMIREMVLEEGDVISLSNVSLVYGEGAASRQGSRRRQFDDGETTLAFRTDDQE